MPNTADPDPLTRLLRGVDRSERVTHVERLPARPARTAGWPTWVPPLVADRLRAIGIAAPWVHQAAAAQHAWAGRCVIVATGPASGKSLAYLLPALSGAVTENVTTLYLTPTKALATDQLRAVSTLGLHDVRAATYDGDTSRDDRDWARAHANVVLTNPDMLHCSLLPGHARWAPFLSRLRFVVVDEVHGYRGVFGSHVALALRRLRRVCARYGSAPVFVLASATVSEPGTAARKLVGLPVVEVTDDGSPRGAQSVVLFEPGPTPVHGGHGVPTRRTAVAEAAELLADLVTEGIRTIAFVRSRRGAEALALATRRALLEADPTLGARVAAYRGGYLPSERRELERALHDGTLLGLAATSALELGVDIVGLDAVLVVGWPGTLASLWQQVGRAGRAGQAALAVFIARDDPLDSYLVRHPEAVFHRPLEATVLDPENPYILAPHLCAAAAELPLTEADLELFGPGSAAVRDEAVRDGRLRRRPAGWYWTRPDRATDLADIRGTGGRAFRVVETGTGRLLGTVDPTAAHLTVHQGAVYLHQGETYLVQALELADSVAMVERADPGYTTAARQRSAIAVIGTERTVAAADASWHFGTVDVTSQVVGYLRRQLSTGAVLSEEALDLPARQLRTRAVWWTTSSALLDRAGVPAAAASGAAHAAEHAAIGMLPLVATCDRWDIGGVSTALHPDTGRTTVFVYDGQPGGAGFAARGFAAGRRWLGAVRDVIGECACTDGCPSCVQSPMCGSGNEPLDKHGARRLLAATLAELGEQLG